MPRILQPQSLKQGLGIVLMGLVIGGSAVGGWLYGQHHFWTALKGPTEITLDQLAKIEKPGELPSTWVKVAFEKAVKTKVQIVETGRGSESVAEEYWLFEVGDRWMIAIVQPSFKGNVLSGQVWHNTGSLNREAFTTILQDYQDIHQGKLIPFEFHAEQDYGSNWKAFAVVMGVFTGIGGLLAAMGLGGIVLSFRPADAIDEANELAALDPQTTAAANAAMARFLRDAQR